MRLFFRRSYNMLPAHAAQSMTSGWGATIPSSFGFGILKPCVKSGEKLTCSQPTAESSNLCRSTPATIGRQTVSHSRGLWALPRSLPPLIIQPLALRRSSVQLLGKGSNLCRSTSGINWTSNSVGVRGILALPLPIFLVPFCSFFFYYCQRQNWRSAMETSVWNPLFLRLLPPPKPVHPSIFPKSMNASLRSVSSVSQGSCAELASFRLGVSRYTPGRAWGYGRRVTNASRQVACETHSGVDDTEVTSSQFEGFDIVSTCNNEDGELKIGIEVSRGKTEAIFNEVFDRMVAAAQPIPGFRREKGGEIKLKIFTAMHIDGLFSIFLTFLILLTRILGSLVIFKTNSTLPGKTPNIPRHILLEILGPSRVYKDVIKRIIDSTVAEYIDKKQLKVSRNLKVEQSFEDLEASFEPGEALSFDAVLKLLD
ncbi:hypothetical protein MLD38_012042 [Melastoma candidum]|uniref:Uncharacterized protein n=1 Tax=Melastoma candidum TaxID=119954 RepID=A0ACB9R6T5_9MYRT|nr:hypothetical protein MLD38_012042 [Melastoma candidum]